MYCILRGIWNYGQKSSSKSIWLTSPFRDWGLTIEQFGKLHKFLFLIKKFRCFKTMCQFFNKHLNDSFFGKRFKVGRNRRNRNSFKIILHIFMCKWLPCGCIHIKIYFLLWIIRMKVWVIFAIEECKYKLAWDINSLYRDVKQFSEY